MTGQQIPTSLLVKHLIITRLGAEVKTVHIQEVRLKDVSLGYPPLALAAQLNYELW